MDKNLLEKLLSSALQCNVKPALRQTLLRLFYKNVFKGTAKKTKTNSLWIVLNYAMWNSLIFYHWLLIPFSVSVSGFQNPSFSAAGYLTRLISNINNRNKLQLMQIIWNVMLYSQHFIFHWKLLLGAANLQLPVIARNLNFCLSATGASD